MECGQLNTLLQAIASCLYVNDEGKICLNVNLFGPDCSELSPFINCDINHLPPEDLIKMILGADSCGNNALNLTSEFDCVFDEISIGTDEDYTAFDDTGHQTMGGEARPWRDELGDALNIQRSGAGITNDLAECVVNFDHNAAYNANPALADMLYKNVQMNHDKDLEAEIHPHIHWFQAKDYSPNLLLEYRWQINGGTKTTDWTKIKCNNLVFPYGGVAMHQISYCAPILAPAGADLSDIIQFRIYRDTTNASAEFDGNCPYNTGGNASVGVMSFDIHFQTNSLGSNEEYTK